MSISWTDALRRTIDGVRGISIAGRPLDAQRSLWLLTNLEPALAAALRRGPLVDPAEAAGLLTFMRAPRVHADLEREAIALLVATTGLGAAVEALVASLASVDGRIGRHPQLDELRMRAATCSDAELEAAREIARHAYDAATRDVERTALAFAFPDEGWADALLDASPRDHHTLVTSTRDAGVFARAVSPVDFFAGLTSEGGAAVRVLSALAFVGVSASTIETVLALHDGTRLKAHRRGVVSALERVDHDVARGWLDERAERRRPSAGDASSPSATPTSTVDAEDPGPDALRRPRWLHLERATRTFTWPPPEDDWHGGPDEAVAHLIELLADLRMHGKHPHRVELRSVRWFLANVEYACASFVPMALGGPGPTSLPPGTTSARALAEEALRWLDGRGHRAAMMRAAERGGPDAVDALLGVLHFDPRDVLATALARLPKWADARALVRPRTIDVDRPLGLEATGNLVRMLSLSRVASPFETHAEPGQTAYPGIAIAKQVCTPASLAGFAWSLFEAWLAAGAPLKEAWAMNGIAHLGNDASKHRFAELLEEWHEASLHARAKAGLDVLLSLETDAAVTRIVRAAERSTSASTRERASEAMWPLAAARGVHKLDLRYYTLFDGGLDGHGALVLDFGPRAFTVTVDAQLELRITDTAGTGAASLPKSAASDDPEKSAAAVSRFKALKRELTKFAAHEARDLERAMIEIRRFPLSLFTQIFLRHPLLQRLVRRVLWAAYTTRDAPPVPFRVDADGAFNDAADRAIELPPGAKIGIPHPLEISADARVAFARVFEDYQLLQPFPQLVRDVYALDGDGAARLEGMKGRAFAGGSVLALLARGWQPENPPDDRMLRALHGRVRGAQARLEITPGILQVKGQVPESQTAVDVSLDGDAVGASELLRDLSSLSAP